MSRSSNRRRDHARNVRFGIKKRQAARAEAEAAASGTLPAPFAVLELDRERARKIHARYGFLAVSPPFYLRQLGLKDVLPAGGVDEP